MKANIHYFDSDNNCVHTKTVDMGPQPEPDCPNPDAMLVVVHAWYLKFVDLVNYHEKSDSPHTAKLRRIELALADLEYQITQAIVVEESGAKRTRRKAPERG